MDLAERAAFMLFGGALGFVLGYIVRSLREIQKDVHEVRDAAMGAGLPPAPPPTERKRDDQGSFNFQSVALLVVVILVAYAAFVSQKTSNQLTDQVEQDKIERCKAGPEARNVTRELVEAVYKLATGNLKDVKIADLSPKDVVKYNTYIHNVNSFRDDMYAKIKPSEECRPYVEDDNVKPPSDPFPLVEIPSPSR